MHAPTLNLTRLWHVIRPGLAISPVVALSYWIINQSIRDSVSVIFFYKMWNEYFELSYVIKVSQANQFMQFFLQPSALFISSWLAWLVIVHETANGSF
jgi:hypothetical protein